MCRCLNIYTKISGFYYTTKFFGYIYYKIVEMIKQTWDIDEDEKNRILNLHESATKRQYLTLEQAVQPIVTKTTTSSTNTVFPTQNIGNQFKFGEYQSDVVKNSIVGLKPKIDEFIKNSGGKQFIVNISAGESNVTNPKGFETKGSLALARANSVKQYFQEIFPELIKNGILIIKVPADANKVVFGKTPYDKTKGDNKNPKKIELYNQEQFVTFDIEGTGEVIDSDSQDICQWPGKQIKSGQGEEKYDYVLTNQKLFGKGDITFDTGTIPDRLVILNKGGSVTQDTGYVTTRAHRYKEFKWVPLYVYQLTLINSKNNVSVSGSKIIKITANSYEELFKQLLIDPTKSFGGGGDEVGDPLDDLKRLCEQGVKEFVVYTQQTSPVTLNFNGPSGESGLKVYSPIGTYKIKTGYSVTANCNKTI